MNIICSTKSPKSSTDCSGQITKRFYTHGELQEETLGNGLSLQYTYDKTGRPRTITFPDQTGVEYIYDAVDLKEVHRLINGKRTYKHLNQAHTLAGQVTKAQLAGNNGEINYTYDTPRTLHKYNNSIIPTICSPGWL